MPPGCSLFIVCLNTCLKRIIDIYWLYVVSISELNKLCGCGRISTAVKGRCWKWLGHVLCIQTGRHCVTALSWTPVEKRKVGRPRTTWCRTVERRGHRLDGGCGTKRELVQNTGRIEPELKSKITVVRWWNVILPASFPRELPRRGTGTVS